MQIHLRPTTTVATIIHRNGETELWTIGRPVPLTTAAWTPISVVLEEIDLADLRVLERSAPMSPEAADSRLAAWHRRD